MISKDKLENYFAVLSIMEVNLAEYSKILQDLIVIQGEIHALNVADIYPDEQELAQISKDYSEGDALSRLLKKAKTVMRRPSNASNPPLASRRPSIAGASNPFSSTTRSNSTTNRLSTAFGITRNASFNRQPSFNSRPSVNRGSVSFVSGPPSTSSRGSILRNTQGENSISSANTDEVALGGKRPSILKSVKF